MATISLGLGPGDCCSVLLVILGHGARASSIIVVDGASGGE